MKIHIIGGPGSGKTTLAADLAKRFTIPHHDLDRVFMKRGNQPALLIQDAIDIAVQPDWVAEGAFIIWVEPLLEAADCILLCTVPWYAAYWRAVRRHFEKTIKGINPYPTRQLLPFLGFVYDYYTKPVGANASENEVARQYLAERARRLGPSQPDVLLRDYQTCEESLSLTDAFTRLYLAKYQAKVLLYRSRNDLAALLNHLGRSSTMSY